MIKQGFHSNLDCHYVRYNSGRDFYEFIIRLDSCGSKWVDELSIGGQAYLENVIIIQNEPGIQEVLASTSSIDVDDVIDDYLILLMREIIDCKVGF